MNKLFTIAEIKAKVGTVVRVKQAYLDIPAGTEGLVINRDDNINGTLPVLWRIPAYRPINWFSRDDYYTYLAEVNKG